MFSAFVTTVTAGAGVPDRSGRMASVVELTVRAALKSRDHVYQAALLDPNTAATLTTAEIVAMCDDLFEAHKALLPVAFALTGQ